jgi:hypothetical protein
MEVGAILGLVFVIIVGLVLISAGSQAGGTLSTPLFLGGLVAVLAAGFALYRTVTD